MYIVKDYYKNGFNHKGRVFYGFRAAFFYTIGYIKYKLRRATT